MANRLEIRLDTASLDELALRYGSMATAKAVNATRTYTQKLQRQARSMLQEKGKVDTGELIRRIQPGVSEYGDVVQGQVNAGAKYSRFIHEGAEHNGQQIAPHFVPFAVAPSLLLWAKRNRVVQKKGDKWYFKAASGRDYPINIRKGGLMVKQEPIPYFRVPFEQLAPAYFEKIKEIL